MQFFRTRTLHDNISQKEKNPKGFIPYLCHLDSNTLVTKSYELVQVIEVAGFSFETADDEDLEIRKNLRNSLLKSIVAGNISLYFHTIRKREQLHQSSMHMDPRIVTSDNFLDQFFNQWQKRYANQSSFFNSLYASIVYKPNNQGVALLEYWLKKLQSNVKDGKNEEIRELRDNIYEVSTRIFNTFRDYSPKLLGIEQEGSLYYSEILEFLAQIVNCGHSTPILVPRANIDEMLTNTRLFFGKKALEARAPTGRRFAGIISVMQYTPHTFPGIFDNLLRMPYEFIMTQSFKMINKTVAVNKMQLQQNRMIQAEDKAVSQIAEISQALDMATGGELGFGDHHISVLCVSQHPKELENVLSMMAVELSNCGMQPVRETVNLEASYWGQLPGNDKMLARISTINTLNMASFASMHNYPKGKAKRNHWGDYLTILDTTSGTSFYFNFHVRDVGHTLIIGPTGAGKTVLMNFLCAQAQKFKPRMFLFDKDHGAEIFVRSLEGVYIVINPTEDCGFNPLKLPDTPENRSFLLEWLKLLVTTNDPNLSAEDVRLLDQMIEGNYRLNFADRKLSNVVPFLGIANTGSLANRIGMWHGNGSHARLFDNPEDKIDLFAARNFGFEMSNLLKDPYALGPALSYIFHRINISLDGSNTMIVLDEAWALIDNPVFAPKIKDWLKVLRKLNTFVIFATQSVEDAAASSISDTLIQQTATQIFLPNLKATDVYRKAFMLSQREYDLIKTLDPSSRYFLVKQGVSAVIARIDLRGMDDIINVLSGRVETVLLLNRLRKEHGEHPQDWLRFFYAEASKV
ncbi:Type IV secretion system protein VirB4 [Rickettsiales endosymbiont of Paramecium tredecaurelia]|uniref:VirB4 family type IV secretion/conjugal transfer ATPase n=1 Tax=Candidatus Sarmatiella mevalonica TaxID=2770581 RepID=UPI001922C338|nr:VirB4 family type IV secretion/conjugal transfer ATPase [Candidatus Sarmatiella mevalonica]MBL3284644.1 Type IV secretion system protein VirB4 [Candidatus Sarmatiella mevalonica]